MSSPINRSSSNVLFQKLEQEYATLNRNLSVLPTDDSDEEGSSKQGADYPRIVHMDAPSSADMTVESSYCGRTVRFKGNQLILWARDMMQRVINIPDRETRIFEAITARKVTIRSSDDWLVYEGMFDAFGHLLSKPSQPFYGIATIFMGSDVSTTVEFRNKINKKKDSNGTWSREETSLLYAHIHDKVLADDLSRKFPKYRYPDNHGLSYGDIVTIIERIKTDNELIDSNLAQRQLSLLKGSADGPINIADRFLSYFNAILFGSETSRNSLAFATGILVLDMIAQEKLTYIQSFQSPDYSDILKEMAVPYAVYPMASPYSGENNFKAYKKLMDLSTQEQAKTQLSSDIGMKASRKRSQWTQIQIKEAILFKFWTKDWDHQPSWLNASTTNLGEGWLIEQHGHAVEFARRFNQSIISLLHNHFPRVPKLLVYSRDEQYALGGFKPSNKVWKDSSNLQSTEVDFNAMDWLLTTVQPLRLEKDIYDAMSDIQAEAYAEMASMGIDSDEYFDGNYDDAD